ncbi:WGR and DUF4132 domain-containing protein [Polyangium sp. 15x6]|uniref:WGR and DUF4132 domain-containing protein n=1 Tax=Polyangium sp. 15x6 TaxID=3042687 RepID=UPI00249BB307|nr:WGR and DUF4132 domain-containing protein [Polyangium sp. 15x6]MDI3281690.1 WGR and DUF4132 domain-containing protein [Polyangium sp. 15x6]
MRRFEFVEGASKKFWQIERDGSQLSIQWGKIGTAGQSQVKDFPSDQKAQTEHDKLVAEKTKKGYVEVAAPDASTAPAPKKAAAAPAEPSATPPPAPKVASAPPPATDEPAMPAATEAPVVLDIAQVEDIRRNVHMPHRKGVLRPTAEELAADPWQAVQTAWAAWAPFCPWDQMAIPAELAPAVREARAFLEGKGPTPISPLAAAVLDDLLDMPHGPPAYPLLRALADASIAKDGPGWLLDAVLAVTRVRIEPWPYQIRNKEAKEFSGFSLYKETSGPFELDTNGTPTFAFYTQNLPDDTYGALIAAITTRWPTLSYWQKRLALALIPDHTPLADALGEEWLACDGHVEGYVRPTWDKDGIKPEFRFAYSRPILLKLAKKTVAMSFSGGYLGGYLWTLLDLCGADVVPVCRIHCDNADYAGIIVEGLQVATHVIGPETASLMVSQLAQKREIAQVAEEWLAKNPALAVAPLADAIAAASTLGDRAASVFLGIDRAHPGLADKIDLRPAARTAVQKLREKMAPRPDASPTELPRILLDPPWISGRWSTALPLVVRVAMQPYAEVLHDAYGELSQAKADREQTRKHTKTSFEEASENINHRWVGKYVSGRMSELSDADVKRAFAEWPAKAWDAGYGLLVPLVVLGVDAIGGYPRIASANAAHFASALADVVESPRLATFFAHARTLKSARKSAERWFTKFPKAAATGLIPTAVGPHSKAREHAEEAVRFLVAKGHGEIVREAAESYGSEVEAAVKAVLSTDPRDRFPAKLPKIGDWAKPEALPTLLVAGRAKGLPRSAVEALLVMLAISTPENVYAGLEDVFTVCDPASLEEFSWALFNEWQRAGAPSKEAWGFQQLGLLGGDSVARKLTPLIRAWPGENLQARAVSGLDILARIGSDLALMHLNGIAQKVKFKGLQEKARAKMDEVAQNRGLSADELADRLVPDLDLDEDGSRTLDFGARQFRVGFDEALKPYVVDGSGKTLSDLPKPGKSDDAAKAKEADTTWKTLKKDVKAIAQNQITRLELAMCAERRWEVNSFRALFLEHPLLVHLVRRLVWGVYTEEGKYLNAFRVAEDSSLADADDAAFDLPDNALVGIVHPLALPDATRAAFGQILGDYGILQPFPQIGRDTYAPTSAEATDNSIKRRAGQFVPVGKLLGLVERGWRKGEPQDAGWIWDMEKRLPGGVVATLALRTGISADMQYTEPKQEIGEVYVSKNRDGFKLGELTPVVFSELVRDLVQLGSAS